jgi:dCMP deaminase
MTPYDAMQSAVDIVASSDHPTNKIAACVVGVGLDDAPYTIRAVNHWPAAIATALGPNADIGNSSGTVHAETACILAAPCTHGATLYITDPFCPNCAKNIAESGIKHIMIDHKGFEKDFITRRANDFTDLSLHIVERAGVSVSMIYRKERRIVPIITPAPNFIPPDDRPVTLLDWTPDWVNQVRAFRPDRADLPFAAAVIEQSEKKVLITQAHIIRGYSEQSGSDRAALASLHTGKYTMVMEPVNRLMMVAARLGARIDPSLVVSSRVPTSRELVNMVAGGYTNVCILDRRASRDGPSVEALEVLTGAGVIQLA